MNTEMEKPVEQTTLSGAQVKCRLDMIALAINTLLEDLKGAYGTSAHIELDRQQPGVVMRAMRSAQTRRFEEPDELEKRIIATSVPCNMYRSTG